LLYGAVSDSSNVAVPHIPIVCIFEDIKSCATYSVLIFLNVTLQFSKLLSVESFSLIIIV